jgi:redox-sensitive bicupin YhaK (pirin superfamily)
MTAGRGVVHSERRPKELRDQMHTNHGLQLWAALPEKDEEVEPAFFHTPAELIPIWEETGVTARVLIGNAYALTSPVRTFAETLYLDIQVDPGATLTLAASHAERAIYSVDHAVTAGGEKVECHTLAVLDPGAVTIAAPDGARLVVIGGEPISGYRHMWWNFVSSRKERIQQAKNDWLAQKMGAVPGDDEWTPLPD